MRDGRDAVLDNDDVTKAIAVARVLFVQEDIADKVCAMLAGAMTELKVGDPGQLSTDVGPVIDEDAKQILVDHAARMDKEAKKIAEVKLDPALTGHGTFFAPRAYEIHSLDVLTREVFGPVVTVQRFSDEAQAIEWANGVEYGLSASVWTRDVGRALAAVRRLQFGTVWINDHLPLVSEMPWGGRKASGLGSDMSAHVLDDYTVIKHVMAKFS